eukprot:CAMPEP_0173436520 /NCGR_PEP_ID=MMETSP1357-20121228/16319_1 /TAXON_ID=77926 /ORGANISM="Hemiselmis rufescens, Strain PCC563" /LENGTH=374 /DNA_ID=CAMNT_0014401609 /DNA_START=58 /DNA_END=1182 /DNA_ORIENTATION=+
MAPNRPLRIVAAIAVLPIACSFAVPNSITSFTRSLMPEASHRVRGGCAAPVSPTMALGKKSTAKDVIDAFSPDLKGKVAVVTGGNSGIGIETVKALASAGARVVLCSRSVEAGEKAVEDYVKASEGREIQGGYSVPSADVRVVQLDLADLASVDKFVKELESEASVDYLVLNAGVMAGPKRSTAQGFERQIGTNHIGHFHLTSQLLPRMKAQENPSRIVVVASTAHQMGKIDVNDLNYQKGRSYTPWGAYGQSKLANILFAKGLQDRLKDTKVSATSLHPGVIATPLWRDTASLLSKFLMPLFIRDKSPQQGAATTVYGCLADEGEVGGAYLDDCKVATPKKTALSVQDRDALWETTERILAEAVGSKEAVGAK